MRRPLVLLAASAAAAATLAGLGLALAQTRLVSPNAATPLQLLTAPLPQQGPAAAEVARGRSLVIAGDCLSCHTRPGGAPLAGGLGMNTPFGVIYTPNITSDRDSGVGDWTADQFYRAMHEGRSEKRGFLYPAFPYVYFTNVTRADTDAILAYLKTTPAVRYQPPGNKLPFPFNIRQLMWGWNLLFFRAHTFQPDASKSAQWNRGAYLVNGLGHCSQCHTPTNFLGANQTSQAFRGGLLDNYVAPDLTANPRTGLGSWSQAEIVEYLKTGRNARANASAAMAEVVSYSTSLMSEADLQAIATYLRSQPPSPTASPPAPDPAAMQRGEAIFSDTCAACHMEGARGQPRFFPPLGGSAVVQQTNPAGVLRMILAGTRTAPTLARPTPLTMPSYAWKLTDQQIADVTTYVRNSWGNRAAPVSAGEVSKVRSRLDLKTSAPTANSGDRP
jgi:mono/diheme cytochrome c family protein